MIGRFALGATLAAVAALAIPAAGVASPESSGPVSRYAAPFAFAFFDGGLVALGGPPPERGCVGEGFEEHLGEYQAVETGAGPLVYLIRGHDLPMRVYEGNSLGDVCQVVLGGGQPRLLADGVVQLKVTDNDVHPSGQRQNVFGGSATGHMTQPDGTPCQFAAHARLQITRDGEFRITAEKVVLRCQAG